MANKDTSKEKRFGYPTHILVPDNPNEETCIMFTWNNGDTFFEGNFTPKRGHSYKLIVHDAFEQDYAKRVSAS